MPPDTSPLTLGSLTLTAPLLTTVAVTAAASGAIAAAGTYWYLRSSRQQGSELAGPSSQAAAQQDFKSLPQAPAQQPSQTETSVSTSSSNSTSSRTQQYESAMPPTWYSPINTAKRRNPYDPSPRSGSLSWDDYFMALAFLSAERSKDPNKQVGACIVNADNVILGIGYNGFPRGCHDNALPWSKSSYTDDPLETKYPYVVHAEANALLNKNLASVNGAKIYVTMFPCNECAKLLIQAGVKEVVYHEAKVHISHTQEALLASTSASDANSDPFGFTFAPAGGKSSSGRSRSGSRSGSGSSRTVLSNKSNQVAPSASVADSSDACTCADGACTHAGGKAALKGGQKAPLSSQDVCYMASLKLLNLAGVKLRQHCLNRPVILPGAATSS